jgi:hypothetical protein
MRSFVLAFFILMPSLGYCELIPFDPIKNDGFYDLSSFTWSANENHYSLNANGVLTLTSKTSSSRQIKLPIDTFVVQISLLNHSGDIFIALETDFAGDGQGFICSVKNNLASVNWCQKIPSFNIRASASNDSIWIGALGFVARLNWESGKFYWNHNNLYRYCANREDSFNVVWPVAETESTIVFDSEGSNPGNKRQLLIEKGSGKIIQAKDNNSNRICPELQERN